MYCAQSSKWGLFGRNTRSAIQGTSSRCSLGVLSVVARCFEARYKRGKREGNLNKQHFFNKSIFLKFGSSLVHPWFFLGSSLVTNTDNKRKVQGKGFLIKVLFTNTSYIRQTAYPNAIRRQWTKKTNAQQIC